MTISAETPYEGKISFQWPQSDCRIGKYCSFADNITVFLGGNHQHNLVTTCTFEKELNIDPPEGHPSTNGDVVIGHDVWIGSHVTIMSGSNIGTGAIIGAHSVVAGNIPPYGVVMGNPAEVKYYRFTPGVVQVLLTTRWWDWPEDLIKKSLELLRSKPNDGVLVAMLKITSDLIAEGRISQ